MKKQCGYYIYAYYQVPTHTPMQSLSISAARCHRSTMCLLCYTVIPVIPHTMCTEHNAPQSPSPFLPTALPHASPLITAGVCESAVLLLQFCFVVILHKWGKSFGTCLSPPGLVHWGWCPPDPCMLLRIVNLFLSCGWVVFHCVYVPCLLCPFIYWWTLGLLPYLGYCK